MHEVDEVAGGTFDVVVAGGSFAGSASAVAFARAGARVLLCEPGLASERRLAGELLQAPAVELLTRLGFIDDVWAAGAIPCCGFAIFPGGERRPVVLSYAEVDDLHPSGLAVEHATLAHAMLLTVAAHPNVTCVRGRVVPPVRWNDAPTMLAVESVAGRAHVTAALVVAADGRASKLRDSAGIKTTKGRSQRMLGMRIEDRHLPAEGYGHVFLGGKSPVLAYRIGPRHVRFMFEVDEETPLRPHADDLAAIPPGLAAAVAEACAERRALSAVIFSVQTASRTAGRLALVGDAAGAAHPITASGVSFALSDAATLAACYEQSRGDVARALRAYEAARVTPALTRGLLAPALRRALGEDTEAMHALRDGLLQYWQSDRRGRAASMGLLSTRDANPSTVVAEYGRVVAHSLHRLHRERRGVAHVSKIGWALGKESLSLAASTLSGALRTRARR